MPQRPAKTSQRHWPDDESSAHWKLLDFLSRLREREGRRSYEEIARSAHLSKARVQEIFTAAKSAKPDSEAQVELLVRGCGGGDDDVAEGSRHFENMLADRDAPSLAGVPAVRFAARAGHLFVPRGSLAERYRAAKDDGAAVVVLAGPAGCGKTELALFLATNDESRDGGRLQIRCASEWDLAQSLRRLLPAAKRAALATLEQLLTAFHEFLRGRRPPFPVLVLDDVRNEEQVRALLPEGTRGDFIVTTRQRRLRNIDEGAHIDVGPLTDDETDILVKELAPTLNPGDVRALSAAAGNHPLAIEAICGAAQQGDPLNARRLVRELREDIAILLDQAHDDGRPGLTSVYRTMCAHLQTENQLAYRLLGLIAFAATGPLETAVLMTALRRGGPRPIVGLETARAIGRRCLDQLRQLYLVQTASDSRTAVEMHDLTRSIIREVMIDQGHSFIAQLHESILALMAEHLRTTRSETDVLELIPQLFFFGRHLLPSITGIDRPASTFMLPAFKQYLQSAAKMLAAIGANPSDYYLLCAPTARNSYALRVGTFARDVDHGQPRFMVGWDVADLKAWAPDDSSKLRVIKTLTECAGPDGPTRMYGLAAIFVGD